MNFWFLIPSSLLVPGGVSEEPGVMFLALLYTHLEVWVGSWTGQTAVNNCLLNLRCWRRRGNMLCPHSLSQQHSKGLGNTRLCLLDRMCHGHNCHMVLRLSLFLFFLIFGAFSDSLTAIWHQSQQWPSLDYCKNLEIAWLLPKCFSYYSPGNIMLWHFSKFLLG